MHWVAVHAPHLALDYALRHHAHSLPCALCSPRHVIDCNPAAQALGIMPGMSRSTALCLSAQLVMLDEDPNIETRALHALATALLPFTPTVSLASHQTVLLQVAGSLRLFGGLNALINRVRQAVKPFKLSVHISHAPTAQAAWLLAQYQDGLGLATRADLQAGLAPLPLSLLPTAAPHADRLAAMGIHHLGALMRLPRAGLARRYGQALLADLDAALGERTEPHAWFEPPAPFQQDLELPFQTTQLEPLLAAIEHLLHAWHAWLIARHATSRHLTLEGEHPTGRHALPRYIWQINLGQPSQHTTHWLHVIRERLITTTLPAPLRSLRLICTHIEPHTISSGLLFDAPTCATISLSHLVERLQARLGPEQVHSMSWRADHRPEQAHQQHPLHPAMPLASPAYPNPMRPLWLLDPALPLTERMERPWWDGGPLTVLNGPERIETGWWDNTWVQRDYFIAKSVQGRWLWIYHNRVSATQAWYLHGLFG